jgi:hypothetical protein
LENLTIELKEKGKRKDGKGTGRVTQRVDGEALSGREVEKLALESEIITVLGATEDTFARWTDDFDSEIVKFEGIVFGGGVGHGKAG